MINKLRNVVEVKVPGKLYMAGEYAVVSPLNPAIAFAVDAFIDIKIKISEDRKIFDHSNSRTFDWHINGQDKVVIEKDYWRNLELTSEAMTVTLNYISEKIDLDLRDLRFSIDITNGLRNENGKKYGFGSSGAATIATCQAILKLFSFDNELTHEDFALLNFKLATIAQTRLNKLGSFGDLAACSYGGLIYYQNFSREILSSPEVSSLENISSIVDSKWDGLEIIPLELSEDWTLSIVWSEKSSSTEKLIANDGATLTPEQKDNFLANSKRQVREIYQAIQDKSWETFSSKLKENADGIKEYLQLENRPYILPSFLEAEKIAEALGSVFKISGAGAGDCAIAISPTQEIADRLEHAWRDAGLTVLTYKLWQYT